MEISLMLNNPFLVLRVEISGLIRCLENYLLLATVLILDLICADM